MPTPMAGAHPDAPPADTRAALVVIGDEILSGRTTDANLPYLAKRLNELGFAVQKMSQADFQSFVQNQITGWAPAVKASGAKLN